MSTSQDQNHFDLHVTGYAELGRVRDTNVRGRKLLCCKLSSREGSIDTIVYGGKAKLIVERLRSSVDNKQKVQVTFKVSDLWSSTYVSDKDYGKNIKAGSTQVMSKGRLLQIYQAFVDGQEIDLSDINGELSDMARAIPRSSDSFRAMGVGYLNRVKLGSGDEGQLRGKIAALRGAYSKDGSVKPEVTDFNVLISGDTNRQIIERLNPFGDEKHKILVQFIASDFKPTFYVPEKDYGKHIKAGVPQSFFEGRLVEITRAWVNGESVDLSDLNEDENWFYSDELGDYQDEERYASFNG